MVRKRSLFIKLGLIPIKIDILPENVNYVLNPIGFIRSSLQTRKDAPKQGYEGAPDAWMEVKEAFAPALQGVNVGDELILVTWFHLSNRDTLRVHPRGDRSNPLTGYSLRNDSTGLAVAA